MDNNNITIRESTSFWNFLQENKIEIPIIQRDYAQGRLGKEYLRKSFLDEIKKALVSGNQLKLDFVYGSVNDKNGKLSPLDGQQRLTTLWLLHWYIALMSGNLNEKSCMALGKFSYETRISSREFCQNMCIPANFATFKDFKTAEKRRIVDFITSRTWFYSAWKQDPTIQSMLRMLGGTEAIDKSGEDIVDGLEELFKDSNTDFSKYWRDLTENSPENSPIVFYHLPLSDFGLSDDLYIKMNARGKPLTSFENFKADLVGYIRKKVDENKAWDNLLDATNGIPIKLDTDWTDIFWNTLLHDKRIDKIYRIDEIYFAFLNRFFLCELICQNTDNTEDDLKNNPTYKYLYRDNGNDRAIEYNGFEKYRYFKNEIPKSFFKNLENVLNRLPKDIELNDYFPEWVEKEFQFIPKYTNDNTITTLTQNGRVVFHAVSKYLQIGEFDKTSFKRWMRVVWNIVENNNAGMIGAMRLIDELGEHSHEIYKFLVSKGSKIKSEAAKEQLNEEIAKAKQILDENYILRKYESKKENATTYNTWEDMIIEAEKYAFFKGAIRFLYTGLDNNEDWGSFEEKLQSIKVLIPENIEDRHTIKLLTPYITKEGLCKIFFNNYVSNVDDDLRTILLDNGAVPFLHNFLLQNDKKHDSPLHKDIIDICEVAFDRWSYLQTYWEDDSKYIWTNYAIKSGKYSKYSYVVGNPIYTRISKILDTSFEIHNDWPNKKIGNHIQGLYIQFLFQGYFFTYYGNNKVYLMNKNWDGKKLKKAEDVPENNFCFVADKKENEGTFLNKLNCLIAQAFPNADKSICKNCKDRVCE